MWASSDGRLARAAADIPPAPPTTTIFLGPIRSSSAPAPHESGRVFGRRAGRGLPIPNSGTVVALVRAPEGLRNRLCAG